MNTQSFVRKMIECDPGIVDRVLEAVGEGVKAGEIVSRESPAQTSCPHNLVEYLATWL
jgi:hypothetical protein